MTDYGHISAGMYNVEVGGQALKEGWYFSYKFVIKSYS